jgi:hypothetical protein
VSCNLQEENNAAINKKPYMFFRQSLGSAKEVGSKNLKRGTGSPKTPVSSSLDFNSTSMPYFACIIVSSDVANVPPFLNFIL